jgi:hypothetical protein
LINYCKTAQGVQHITNLSLAKSGQPATKEYELPPSESLLVAAAVCGIITEEQAKESGLKQEEEDEDGFVRPTSPGSNSGGTT